MENTSETKVLILDEQQLDDDLKIIRLRHPGTNQSAYFVSTPEHLYELLSFKEQHRSWFFNNSVASNGQMYIPVQVDPLFFFVHFLCKASPKTVPLQQLIEDEEFAATNQLLSILDKEENLGLIADQKGSDDMKAFKYNEEKVLKWLKKKCSLVVEALHKSSVSTGEQVTSSTFINPEVSSDETSMLVTAHGIVSEYLSVELSKKLAKFLNLPEEQKVSANKRKSMHDLEGAESKKIRPNKEAVKIKAKEEKKTKDMAKAASGTKNIMSFFKKK